MVGEDLKKIIHYAQMELEREYDVTLKVVYQTEPTKRKRKQRRNVKQDQNKEDIKESNTNT